MATKADPKHKRGLRLSKFVNTQGHVLTLDQLRKKEPAAFRHDAKVQRESK